MECSCTQVSTVQLGLSIHHVFGCGCVLVWVSGPWRLICATRAGEVLSSPLWKEWKERREEQRQTERKIWGGEGYKKRRNERVGRAVCMREAKSLWGGMRDSSFCWVLPFLQKFWLVSTEHASCGPAPAIVLSLTLSCPSLAPSFIHLSELLKAAVSQIRAL